VETAGEKGGKKTPIQQSDNSDTPGVSRAHQGEGKKENVEFIVIGISSLIFLPAKGYRKVKPIFLAI